MRYWFSTPTLWFSFTLWCSRNLSSLPVWPNSYPFIYFDPFSELNLKTLLFNSRRKVTFLRFFSPQHFGSGKVHSLNLPHKGIGRLYGLVTILTFFQNQILSGLISYPNAHGILPLECFPSQKADNFFKSSYPLIVLAFSSDLTVKLSMTKNLTFRVLSFKEFVLIGPSVTLDEIAEALMGFCPSKASSTLEIEKISLLFLSIA